MPSFSMQVWLKTFENFFPKAHTREQTLNIPTNTKRNKLDWRVIHLSWWLTTGKILYLKKKCSRKKGQTWKWRIINQKWINYVDPHLPLSKQKTPSTSITFLHMRQSFLEWFLQEKVNQELLRPNILHPQLTEDWKMTMYNQLASITIDVNLILSIRFQVSCNVPRPMGNDPYKRSDTTRWGVNGKCVSSAPLFMCSSRSIFTCRFKILSYF